jgi:hypothetical protein
MNRRRFLGMLGLGTTGLSLLGGTILAPTAEATPALVAIQVVQTAISIAKLFGGGGDLASQIGSMLAAISKELSAIEVGIQEILNRLDEIKELIGEIPKAVVQETERAKITGLLTLYTLQMETYARDCEDQGVAFSQAKNIPPLENQVIIPLKLSVAILTGYHASGMVPIICAASYVHVKAMILANYTKNDLLPVLGMYQRWLKERVELLTYEIGEKSGSMQGLKEKLEGLTQPSPFKCAYSTPAHPSYDGSAETWSASIVYREIDPHVSLAAGDMVANRLMNWYQVPGYAELALTKMNSFLSGPEVIQSFCPEVIDGKRQTFKATAEQFPEIGLQLMSRRALKYAAETTLNALNEQQQRIEQLG